MFRHLIFVMAAAAAVMWNTAAFSDKRVALVIGNGTYGTEGSIANLKNAANDADDMADALQEIGFEVERHTNLAFGDMRRHLRDFSERASRADIALVFFAGHGVEIDGKNYLVPVDARLRRDDDIDFETISLDLVLRAVQGARKLKLVLLDACRNNPFVGSMQTTSSKRSIGRGLARVEPAVGTLVGFAAKEGTTADDGDGDNSPFTQALLRHIREPGLEINFLFRKVRDSVLAATNRNQEPFTYGSLPGDRIYLVPPNAVAKKPEPETVRKNTSSEVAEVWSVTRDTTSIAVIEAFINAYPESIYTSLAKARLKELRAAAQPVVTDPKPEPETATSEAQKPEKVALAVPDDAEAAEREQKPERTFATDRDLAKALQEELNKQRCNAGTVDGSWGPKSRAAVKKFAKHAKLNLDTDPSVKLLDVIEAYEPPICPLECGPRFDIVDDKCVLKTCSSGLTLARNGKCIKVAVLDRSCYQTCLKGAGARCVARVMASNGLDESGATIVCVTGADQTETAACRRQCTRR